MQIFEQWPSANTYATKHAHKNYSQPGSNDLIVTNNVCIVNMYAQIYPGNRYNNIKNRPKLFASCLEKLEKEIVDGCTVLFPYKIGCGLAGGDWSEYKKMIDEFAEKIQNTKVLVVSDQLTNNYAIFQLNIGKYFQ